MGTAGAICSKCIYRRTRAKSQLFSSSEKQMSAVLKMENERLQQAVEYRQLEDQRLKAGDPFDYEPYYLPWCDMFTPVDAQLFEVLFDAEGKWKAIDQNHIEDVRQLAKESNQRGKDWIHKAQEGNSAALDDLLEHDSAWLDSVTGEIMQFYALCARMNPDYDCPLFEPKG